MRRKARGVSANYGDEDNGGAIGRQGELTLKLDSQTLDVM